MRKYGSRWLNSRKEVNRAIITNHTRQINNHNFIAQAIVQIKSINLLQLINQPDKAASLIWEAQMSSKIICKLKRWIVLQEIKINKGKIVLNKLAWREIRCCNSSLVLKNCCSLRFWALHIWRRISLFLLILWELYPNRNYRIMIINLQY